jgi:hypothetical protein
MKQCGAGSRPAKYAAPRLTCLALAVAAVSPLIADEGLWPYNQFPQDALKTKNGFETPPGFLDHLRSSSVRIGGGSGAFVSADGLILTSRQGAAGCNLPVDGFASADRTAELRCPNLDASVLLTIEDVTASLKAAGQSLTQRNAAIAKIEKDCSAKTGDVCSVVRLFSGGRYDLYRYKRYSDIRLVFAPEYSAAFFGKERDSITYLRYGLNIAFLRAYDKGQPARTPDYLKWSPDGVKEGDLVFAASNPGATSRLATAAQLTFYRDSSLPLAVARLQTRLQLLAGIATPGAEATVTQLVSEFKSDAGKLIGLRDDRLVTRKTTFEGKIKRAVQNDPKLGADAAKVWDDVAAAYKKWTPYEKPYQVLESEAAPGSKLFQQARRKVRGEAPIASTEPIDNQVEILMLTQYLDELRILGEKESPIKAILGGRTPKQTAEAMVQAGPASEDGVTKLARLIDPQALKLRKQHEEIIGSLEVSAAEKIAQYRFKIFGAADYPDGTGTPRVEFGAVSGYTDRAAVAQPFASTFSGLYYRQNNEGPWQVAQKWIDLRSSLHEVTPLDFVSTCDTGGGDYGSPVVNRSGELVGVTFDGNLESLPNVFLYTSDQARSVHVDVRGIAEALEKVYKTTGLVRELGLHSSPGI